MDHTAAQATLTEIAFGLNTAFAIFPAIRHRMLKRLRDRIDECVAVAEMLSQEPGAAKKQHVEGFQRGLADYSDSFVEFQTWLQKWMVPICIFAAALCLTVLIFDWLGSCGHWLACLVLPVPVYLASEFGNYALFYLRSEGKVKRFRKYWDEFG